MPARIAIGGQHAPAEGVVEEDQEREEHDRGGGRGDGADHGLVRARERADRQRDRRHEEEKARAGERDREHERNRVPHERGAEEQRALLASLAEQRRRAKRGRDADETHRENRRLRMRDEVDAVAAHAREPAERDAAEEREQDRRERRQHAEGHRPRIRVPRREQQQHETDRADPHRPTGRPPDQRELQDVEIRRVVAAARVEVGAGERARGAEEVVAVMLQSARIHVREVVERRVIPVHAADRGEVQRRNPGALEHRHVGVVRQQVVDRGEERRRVRPPDAAREAADQPAIAAAGLEHVARAVRAAVLDVDDDARVARERGITDECFRSDESRFLGVGDQERDRIAMRFAAQRTRDLENRRDADAVIRGAGTRADGVVMRDEQHRAAVRAGGLREDVGDRRAGRQRVARECRLNGGLVSKRAESSDDALADAVRACRMRRLLGEQLAKNRHRPIRRELARGRARRLRSRPIRPPQREHQNHEKRKNNRGKTAHEPAFWQSRNLGAHFT